MLAWIPHQFLFRPSFFLLFFFLLFPLIFLILSSSSTCRPFPWVSSPPPSTFPRVTHFFNAFRKVLLRKVQSMAWSSRRDPCSSLTVVGQVVVVIEVLEVWIIEGVLRALSRLRRLLSNTTASGTSSLVGLLSNVTADPLGRLLDGLSRWASTRSSRGTRTIQASRNITRLGVEAGMSSGGWGENPTWDWLSSTLGGKTGRGRLVGLSTTHRGTGSIDRKLVEVDALLATGLSARLNGTGALDVGLASHGNTRG